MLEILRNSICYNQGELIQFFYLTNYFYTHHTSKKGGDQISEWGKVLDSFIKIKIQEICKQNFLYLNQYYELSERKNVRICVKILSDNLLIDLARNTEKNNKNISVELDSGVKYIIEKGVYYLNNDIPNSIINNEYANPNIDIKKFNREKQSTNEIISILSNWKNYWRHDCNSPNDNNSRYYKSTLIIPMTLKNNALSDLFVKLTKFPNVDREIFGFLCFDSTKINFFNKNDINIGYIFADIISLYILCMLKYYPSL